MKIPKARRIYLVVTVILTLVFAILVKRFWDNGESVASCPHEFSVNIDGNQLNEVPLAGARTAIPMYHDCQRLLLYGPLSVVNGVASMNAPTSFAQDNGAAFTFGPMVGLYVSKDLASFPNVITPVAIDRGLQVAIMGTATPTPTEIAASGNATAVIQFYNHDQTWYHPLGIGAGFTCVYLQSTPTWRAWSINIHPYTTCPNPLPVAQIQQAQFHVPGRVKQLTVNPLDVTGSPTAPVGRFDWSWPDRKHYVSIYCGPTTWCEIGDGHLTSSPTNTSRAPTHLWSVKGWHDEQRLTWVNSPISVATMRGTLVPDANLGTRTIAHFQAGWVRVAEAHLTADDENYKQKLNFDVDPSGVNANQIYYHMEANGSWRAMIVSAQGDTVYRNVLRKAKPPNDPDPVPATARWRWIADDETVWTKCDEGCCEIIN